MTIIISPCFGAPLRTCYSPSTEDGSPPPPVVLRSQLEVGESHRYTGSHTQEDDEYHTKDPVQGVLLASPKCREDVVHFHANGTGWEKRYRLSTGKYN